MVSYSRCFEQALSQTGSWIPTFTGSESIVYGESHVTYTSGSIFMFLNPVNEDNEQIKQGTLKIGDMVGFYNGSITSLQGGDNTQMPVEIEWDGNRYRTTGDPEHFKVGDESVYKKQSFRRI